MSSIIGFHRFVWKRLRYIPSLESWNFRMRTWCNVHIVLCCPALPYFDPHRPARHVFGERYCTRVHAVRTGKIHVRSGTKGQPIPLTTEQGTSIFVLPLSKLGCTSSQFNRCTRVSSHAVLHSVPGWHGPTPGRAELVSAVHRR